MATLDVVTIENQKAGSVELAPAIFEAEVQPHLVHAEVRRQLARRRSGTHSTKNRTAVSGGGSKPWRQKGTGRARQGTTRAPQWAGGGVVFGPVPRSYDHGLPKKVRRAALKSALSHQFAQGAITIVEALDLGEYKTRRVAEALEALGLAGHSVLIVSEGENSHLEVSARNLKSVGVVRAEGLNVYDTLRYQRLLVTKAALERVEERLADVPAEGAKT